MSTGSTADVPNIASEFATKASDDTLKVSILPKHGAMRLKAYSSAKQSTHTIQDHSMLHMKMPLQGPFLQHQQQNLSCQSICIMMEIRPRALWNGCVKGAPQASCCDRLIPGPFDLDVRSTNLLDVWVQHMRVQLLRVHFSCCPSPRICFKRDYSALTLPDAPAESLPEGRKWLFRGRCHSSLCHCDCATLYKYNLPARHLGRGVCR